MKRIIRNSYLSRVEGEGGLLIEVEGNRVSRLELSIFEAPRFFEAFLRGRPHSDVMDFTARICGICPVAYQMSAVHALEKIFGVTIEKPIRDLRRLFYCGEWIESHALHVYLLNGPDFYGIPNAWSDPAYLPLTKRGLRLKKAGNDIVSLLGGRSVHPVSVVAGGFSKVPEKRDLLPLLEELERILEEALEGIRWAAGLSFMDNDQDTEWVSLSHPEEYPMNEGRVLSTSGIDTDMEGFLKSIGEYQVEHSTALHSGIKRETGLSPYTVGPVSRLNIAHSLLPPEIQEVMKEAGISLPIQNSHRGIVARSVEIACAILEAISIIRNYEEPDRPHSPCEPRAGEAAWITEAPRGILIHRYETDEEGLIRSCSIIPPTSQNLGRMERDLLGFVERNTDRDDQYLQRGAEGIIRSYDPCISCSVHLSVVRK